jgi:glycosyltransferase involved in cell wall biosynthesis
MSRLSVLLCSEGTYPFYQGGVSVWCDQLIRELREVDFRVFAITHSPNRKAQFERLPNIAGVEELSLWGISEPGRMIRSFLEIYKRKIRTTPEVIQNSFLNPFQQFLKCLLEDPQPEKIADALLMLHLYFRNVDYQKTMSSPEAWEMFLDTLQQSPWHSLLTLHDATTCMRWLQRFLAIVTVPIPSTDLTHSSVTGLAGVPGVLAKLTRGTPFLLTEHGIYLRELYLSLRHSGYTEACRRFLLAFQAAIVKMNYYFSDCVTALGHFNKRWQVRLGASESKIRIIPNGINPEEFHPRKKESGERLIVLTVARIYHLKGIEYLIRAAALVRQRIPSVLFRVIGEVADQAYYQYCLRLVAENRLDRNVEFCGKQNVSSALAEADVFCLPSISEGMPYSILEAMFSGRPVVATDVGNVSEMLGSAGLVVTPADPVSLAKALVTLLEGGEDARAYRDTMARAAEERALSLYTTEKTIGAFRQLYRELFDGRLIAPMYSAAER